MQVKQSELETEWIPFLLGLSSLSSAESGSSFHVGSQYGHSAGINGSHLLCGGYDSLSGQTYGDCLAITLDSFNNRTLTLLPSLPEDVSNGCYATDGEHMAVAGGWVWSRKENRFVVEDKIYLLLDMGANWTTVPGKLLTPVIGAAGVMIGDTLICIGGFIDEEVGGVNASWLLGCF